MTYSYKNIIENIPLAGQIIEDIELLYNAIHIHLEDNSTITIQDDGQTCCEDRYITTDDNVKELNNEKLRHIILKEFKARTEEYAEHEMIFLEIASDEDSIIFCTHNKHNGYYGGFDLVLKYKDQTIKCPSEELENPSLLTNPE